MLQRERWNYIAKIQIISYSILVTKEAVKANTFQQACLALKSIQNKKLSRLLVPDLNYSIPIEKH